MNPVWVRLVAAGAAFLVLGGLFLQRPPEPSPSSTSVAWVLVDHAAALPPSNVTTSLSASSPYLPWIVTFTLTVPRTTTLMVPVVVPTTVVTTVTLPPETSLVVLPPVTVTISPNASTVTLSPLMVTATESPVVVTVTTTVAPATVTLPPATSTVTLTVTTTATQCAPLVPC